MLTPSRLLAVVTLAAALAGAARLPGKTVLDGTSFVSPGPEIDLENTRTDTAAIVETIGQVDQKGGVTPESIPDAPPADTVITALDGHVGVESIPTISTSEPSARRSVSARAVGDYKQIFDGTQFAANSGGKDGSIQGTAYLTHTVLPNSTYDVAGCLNFCDSVQGCVFANLFYELNNPGLDEGSSNLKCSVYGDVHGAAEKTNTGGQVLRDGYAPTAIQNSSGWGKKTLVEPTAPEGYELAWGPVNGAANAPGYMGFAFLDRYDVDACAAICATRGEDRVGGRCVFFNIWRAVVNGNPTTYTCSMYWFVADQSTANNFGQGDLKVTWSRGYTRKNYVVDGGFEGFTGTGPGLTFVESYSNWVGSSPAGGRLDATIFHWAPFARTGSSLAILGSADGSDALAGTLKPSVPLTTTAGKLYTLQFYQNNAFNGNLQGNSNLKVTWNGATVLDVRPGNEPWTRYEVKLPAAQGNDMLEFIGGAFPSYTFLDDVSVLLGQA